MKYEDIFTFVNLIKAHRKVRRSKLHKNEVVEFELNKSHELYKLYEELNRKTYQISPYRTFYIYEPKKRRVVIEAIYFLPIGSADVLLDLF